MGVHNLTTKEKKMVKPKNKYKHKFQQFIKSAAAVTLLLPTLFNIGVASAEEAPDENTEIVETTPAVEETTEETPGEMEDQAPDVGEEPVDEGEEAEDPAPPADEPETETDNADARVDESEELETVESPAETESTSESLLSTQDVETPDAASAPVTPAQIVEEYSLNIEVRGVNGTRTSDVTIYVQNEDFEVFEGSFNEYLQWSTNNELPTGTYTITLDTPENTYAVINDSTQQFAMPTDEENVFTITLNEENLGSSSAVYGAFQLIEREYRLGVEVRGLDGRRTDDVTIYVQDDDFVVFEGSFNEYTQWLTNDELPAGTYTITLDTPENTYAVINDSTQQFAMPTDEENVFTITLNEENLGSSSAVYGAFQLIEREYRLGVEVRGLDGRRTDEVTIYVQDDDFAVFEGDYNEYLQWLTNDELPAGTYTITLDTPADTLAVINDSTQQFAVPTDEENVFTITLNEENLGSSSAIYGAFQLIEREYQLGVEIRGLDGRRTSDVGVEVTNADGEMFTGSYNDALQWITDENLSVGEYTISLTTPVGTVAEINDTVSTQSAVPTDTENVFTISVNEETLGSLSRVFAAFQLVEEEVATYPLGVEVRDLEDVRTADVEITLTNEEGEIFAGSFNEYNQWLTDNELQEGLYFISLETPEGTVAEINETVASQRAVATDEENVFAILVNEENLAGLSRIYAAFNLTEVPVEVEQYLLGVEVRGLDDRRTDAVDILVTNADGEVFSGDYNQYLQWLTDEELPVGEYTISLTTPEGTVAEINETVASQHAVATDEENVFTIVVNAENRGSLEAVYAAFRLVEIDEEPPTDPEDPDDDDSDTPGDDDRDDRDDDRKDDDDAKHTHRDKDKYKDKDTSTDEDELPKMGIATSPISLGIATILSGLGLFAVTKKRKEDKE
jgi:hypothetical protein